jgi:hypothetical protein
MSTPAAVVELWDGRSETVAEKSTAEVPYLVTFASDEAAVYVAITAGTPSTYMGLLRKEVEIVEHIDDTTWKVMVRYQPPEPGEEGEPKPDTQFSFDTTGGTQHITQNLENVSYAGPGASEDMAEGGAIGFDGETVTGVDITVPVYSFSETQYFTDAEMTQAYKQDIFDLTGSVNVDAFHGFDGGEVLFLGASGSRQGTGADDLWEVTFKFAASKNKTDIMVGTIGPIEKKGWEYLWVQYEPDVDGVVKQLIKTPIAAYVSKVYPEYSFAPLGLPEEGS